LEKGGKGEMTATGVEIVFGGERGVGGTKKIAALTG